MTQPNIYFVNYYGLFKDNIQKIIVSNDLVSNSKYSKGKSLDKVVEMLSRDETGQYFHYPTFLDDLFYYRGTPPNGSSNIYNSASLLITNISCNFSCIPFDILFIFKFISKSKSFNSLIAFSSLKLS